MTLREEFFNTAFDAKLHLEKYPYSICEIRVEADLKEVLTEIVLEVCGADLMNRIKFLPTL